MSWPNWQSHSFPGGELGIIGIPSLDLLDEVVAVFTLFICEVAVVSDPVLARVDNHGRISFPHLDPALLNAKFNAHQFLEQACRWSDSWCPLSVVPAQRRLLDPATH